MEKTHFFPMSIENTVLCRSLIWYFSRNVSLLCNDQYFVVVRGHLASKIVQKPAHWAAGEFNLASFLLGCCFFLGGGGINKSGG